MYCRDIHHILDECACMFGKHSSPQTRAGMAVAAAKFGEVMQKVAAEWEAKVLPDFRVVYQPYLVGTIWKDRSYLSAVGQCR